MGQFRLVFQCAGSGLRISLLAASSCAGFLPRSLACAGELLLAAWPERGASSARFAVVVSGDKPSLDGLLQARILLPLLLVQTAEVHEQPESGSTPGLLR